MAIPTPVPDETLAESDAFWDYWADMPHIWLTYDATSLEENVGNADLVVRGHIVDLYIGEHWEMLEGEPRVPLVYAQIAIGEVFKGSPVSRTPDYVEVGLGSLDNVEDLRANLPQHDNVWFLIHEPNIRPRTPANESDIAPFAYIPTNDQQGVLRNVGGKVRVVTPEFLDEAIGPNHFPLPLQGTSFDELVEQVRDIGEQAPGMTTAPAP